MQGGVRGGRDHGCPGSPDQAVDLHRDQGAEALGHQRHREAGHDQGLRPLRSGALGIRHQRSGERKKLKLLIVAC